MKPRLRPMVPSDETAVRALYAECHPGWPQRPPHWYFGNPTLVVLVGDKILGFASLRLAADVRTCFLLDTCIRDDSREMGLGQWLMDERLRIGRALGAETFVGVTWADNKAMAHMLELRGFHACRTLKDHFKDNDPPTDGVLYMLADGATV